MKIFFNFAITVYILLTVFSAIDSDTRFHLIIRDNKTQETIVSLPVKCGQTFTIRYIHSVDNLPVFEVFRISAQGLMLEETYFKMFGAGMGHWEGHGKIVQDGEWIKIKGINQNIGSFILRVGSKGVDHTILIENQVVNLSEMAAGQQVEVCVEKR